MKIPYNYIASMLTGLLSIAASISGEYYAGIALVSISFIFITRELATDLKEWENR